MSEHCYYQHPAHKDFYCDDEGNVYKNGKLVKGTVAQTGYRQYVINKKSKLGHRLVTECRIGRLLRTEEVVNHLNFDKLDNSKGNLEITTASGNTSHYFAHVVVDNSVKRDDVLNVSICGSKNPMSKLSETEATNLIKDLQAGMTNEEAGNKYGLHSRYVSLVRHKRRWKYLWISLGLQDEITKASSKCKE